MKDDYPIKLLDPSHAKDMSQIYSQCLKASWDEKYFTNILTKDVTSTYGVFDEGELVGFLLATVIADEAEIITFAVKPDYQGRGLGKSLLKNLLQNPDIEKYFLEVSVENNIAGKLYESQGFQKVGIRKEYYATLDGRGVDAIIYSYDQSL